MIEQFVSIYDIGKVLLEYIGSEEYAKASECTDGGKSCLMGGIGMATCIIMSRCKKYLADVDNSEVEQRTTNADKIRAMTDEELARKLYDVSWNVALFPDVIDTEEDWLEWLKEEVE